VPPQARVHAGEPRVKALTRLERRALGLASHSAGASIVVARKHIDGSKDVTRALANRLVLRGLAAITGERLRITHEGQRILKAPLPPVAETYLHKRDGLTTRRDLAVRDEPAVMEAPHPDWRNRAEAHRKLSRADLDAARLSGLDHPEERTRELRLMATREGPGRRVGAQARRVDP
jgi:hypothetical protein